jgi:OmpA-OmpF porin, OOP family
VPSLRHALAYASIASCVALRASAQQETALSAQNEGGLDAESFRLPLDGHAILDVETARTAAWFDFALQVMGTKGTLRVNRFNEGVLRGHNDLVDARSSGTLQLTMPFSRFEVGVGVPVITDSTRSNGTLPDFGGLRASPIEPTGVGDLRVAAKYVLCPENACWLGLAALVGASLPTGNRLAFNGEGVLTAEPEAIASVDLGVVRIAANASFRHHFGSTPSFVTRSDVVAYRFGASTRFGASGTWGLDVSARGQVFVLNVGPVAEPLIGLEGHGAVSYGTNDVRIFAGGGSSIVSVTGVPDLRAMLTVRWSPAPPPTDRDGDGVADFEDACPDIGGFRSRDPERSGCPTESDFTDVDQDGIDDRHDACPREAGVASEEPARHGCPPPPPDADGDGVGNDEDRCPLERGVATDDDRNGCPLPPRDPDRDGIDDKGDACPDEPGVASVDPARHGCLIGAVQGASIVSSPVEFALGSADLSPYAVASLEKIAAVVDKLPARYRYRVDGFADDPGSRAMQRELSIKRARAVVKWFGKRGLDERRFIPVGFGADRPLRGAADRRVTVSIEAERRRNVR